MSTKKTAPELKAETFTDKLTSAQLKVVRPQKSKTLPLIDQVENFLTERFEFRKNIVNEKLECRRIKAFWEENEEKAWEEANKNEEWEEANENAVSRLLQKNWLNFSPGRTNSLLNSDFVNSFNPITEYFHSLKYDPKLEPSYIGMLLSKVKAKDQDRFNLHFKKMLVRCVACSTTEERSNNNFNKHVFVIINREQTIGKSSFIRWLCPPCLKEYFVENLSMDKDGLIALTTCFIINLDELASLSKYDINQLKAKISMASINERLPYGKRRTFYPRRANFLGSTNNDEFLNDDTGNARWLCFEVEAFEPDFWKEKSKNFIDINKVWSEAKYLFDNGFNYQLTLEEKNENEIVNRNYEEKSVEEGMIMNFFDIDKDKHRDNFITTTEVLSYLVNEKHANANKLSLKKIGSVIKKLGFETGSARKGNHKMSVWGYYMKKVVGFDGPGKINKPANDDLPF